MCRRARREEETSPNGAVDDEQRRWLAHSGLARWVEGGGGSFAASLLLGRRQVLASSSLLATDPPASSTRPCGIPRQSLMRALVQRVKRAEVRVEGRPTGTIASGLLVLLGATH